MVYKYEINGGSFAFFVPISGDSPGMVQAIPFLLPAINDSNVC